MLLEAEVLAALLALLNKVRATAPAIAPITKVAALSLSPIAIFAVCQCAVVVQPVCCVFHPRALLLSSRAAEAVVCCARAGWIWEFHFWLHVPFRTARAVGRGVPGCRGRSKLKQNRRRIFRAVADEPTTGVRRTQSTKHVLCVNCEAQQ